MIRRKKEKLFREALLNVKQRCHHVMRESSKQVGEESRAFGAEADKKNYINPEVGFLRIHALQWRILAERIPIEIEHSLIDILKPMSDDQVKKVQGMLIQYFAGLKDEYLRTFSARKAAKGKPNESPAKTFLSRLDTYRFEAQETALNRLHQAISTRRLDYSVSQHRDLRNIIIGFLLGIVASYVASVLWNIGDSN